MTEIRLLALLNHTAVDPRRLNGRSGGIYKALDNLDKMGYARKDHNGKYHLTGPSSWTWQEEDGWDLWTHIRFVDEWKRKNGQGKKS